MLFLHLKALNTMLALQHSHLIINFFNIFFYLYIYLLYLFYVLILFITH